MISFFAAGCGQEPEALETGTAAAEANFTRWREAMVAEQLASPGRDITNRRVLAAMQKIPRHLFVRPSDRYAAYRDHPLPIGYAQTISQPYIVAFMTAALDPQPEDRVLEIGTGSGYQTAVLAELVQKVCTIEIITPLAERASHTLNELGYTNIQVQAGDGYAGWPAQAPFDAIIVTCAPNRVPQPLIDQLKEGGRMIIPVGGPENQTLHLLTKHGPRVLTEAVLQVRFVPMTGAAQASEPSR